jgi:phosphoribosylamine--glycine ligase
MVEIKGAFGHRRRKLEEIRAMAKVLVIGAGGREHALCWRLGKSPQVKQVFCAPGNGGIAEDASCVALQTPEEIIDFCRKNAIGLVVIGPEQPLVDGLADRLQTAGIPVFGPSRGAAQLEGSKGFMKSICRTYGIPTAEYGFFTAAQEAKQFLKGKHYPLVVKADGLAAGKGVIIAQDAKEAEAAIDGMFSGQFGDSGRSVVIEEFLEGEEVSFFALSDGSSAIEFGFAQDHKRAYDRDKGPNTGGMGAYSPTPVMTPELCEQVMQTIILPTVSAMKKEGNPFRGVLFAGLMLTRQGPKLLEYNVRFGDPETQALMARFSGDLYQTLLACAAGELNKADIAFSQDAGVCVVMAAKGYPGDYKKGSVIKNLDKAAAMTGVKVFHAGTEKRGADLISSGGRVLGVTATGSNIAQAQIRAYQAVDAIDWPEGFCRRDIAWRAIKP